MDNCTFPMILHGKIFRQLCKNCRVHFFAPFAEEIIFRDKNACDGNFINSKFSPLVKIHKHT